MKTLNEQKGVKVLSKAQQKSISGGKIAPPPVELCECYKIIYDSKGNPCGWMPNLDLSDSCKIICGIE